MFAGNTNASNNELFGKDLSGMILCTPTTVGSTMGGLTLMGMKTIGVSPEALLFSKSIDSLAASPITSTSLA
jgi:predicted aconitase with swiveling domain